MKIGVEKDQSADGWSAEKTLYTGTYGTLVGTFNRSIKMATLRWGGNNNIPPATQNILVDLSDDYIPLAGEILAPLRQGDIISAKRYDKQVKITLITQNWSGGSLTYPTV